MKSKVMNSKKIVKGSFLLILNYHVFLTDTLSNDIVVALYDFVGLDDKLSFKKGDILQVTEKTSTDWWYGRDSDGRQGFIPVNYVEIKESSSPSGDLTLQVIEALGISF